MNVLDIIPVGHAKHPGGSSGMAKAMEAQVRNSARVLCTIAWGAPLKGADYLGSVIHRVGTQVL